MRKYLLISISFLFSLHSIAQKLILSPKEELSFRNDDFMVVGKWKSYTTVYKNHASVGELIFYNSQMIKEKISTLTFLPSNILKIYFSGSTGHLSVFYVTKENKTKNVFASRMKEDLSWTEPELLMSSSSTSYRNSNDFHFSTSEDNNNTLVYISNQESGIEKLQATVVDRELHQLTTLEQTFSENEIHIAEEATVMNNGMVFLLAADTRNSRGSADRLTLLSAVKGASSFTSTIMPLSGFSVSDIHTLADNTNSILYVCSYFSDSKYAMPRGIYFSGLNTAQLAVTGSYFTPLALQVSSSRKDLKDLKIRNIFLKKGGEVEIVAEKTYQNTRSVGGVAPLLSSSYMMSSMAENTRIVNEFSYDEIVVFNLKIDGSLAWSQAVLKDQTTLDDNGIFSSYAVLRHRLGNAYIFSDMSAKQTRLLAAYISGNGEMTVKELQTSEEADDLSLMPRSAVQISKSEIVMPCVSKNYLCFLKISY